MKLQGVRDLMAYNDWANQRILAMAEKVTPAQFTAPSNTSFGSLQATLVHLLDSEWTWRWLVQGQGLPTTLEPDAFPNVAALRARWQEETDAWRAYVDGLSDDDVTGVIRYVTDTGITRERVLWHALFHVVNHGMQHRSEAAVLLTEYGHSPGDIDFTIFLNERAAAPDAYQS